MLLTDIDLHNECYTKIEPDGVIKWNVELIHKSEKQFKHPMDTFIKCILLKIEDKQYLCQQFNNVLSTCIAVNVNNIKIEQNKYVNNEIIIECLKYSKILAAQYILHCLRCCDFLDQKFKNYKVLYCSAGEVDNTKTLTISSNTSQNYLFNKLFVHNSNICFARIIQKQGLYSFITKKCLKQKGMNFLLKTFNHETYRKLVF